MYVDVLVMVVRARARVHLTRTNTLPPLYRQINREDRLVVREGVCVLGRVGKKFLLIPTLPTHTSPSLTLTYLNH